jgi:hypothetical protein
MSGKQSFSRAYHSKTISLIPLQIWFCTTWEGLLCTWKGWRPSLKEHVQDISAWLWHFYVNFGEKIMFTSLPFKNHLTNSVANLILYNLRGSPLHMKRPKVLIQGTCPGDFRMARSFSGDLLFLYIKCINFREKYHYFESIIHTVVFWLHIDVNQC